MKPRVVFLHYHGIGHINPCLPIASILRAEYEVYFVGSAFFNTYVTAQGYPFYPLYSVPFGLGFEKWVSTIEKKKYIYLSTFTKRINDELYLARRDELVRMLDDLTPDVVLIDSTQSSDFIVLYPFLKSRNIKTGIMHAMFPTHVLPGRPPVNSGVLPEDKEKVRMAIRRLKWKQRKKSWLQKIKFFSFDDSKIIDRRIKKNKFPLKYRSTTQSLFYFTLQNVPEFILAPREFDFPDFKTETTQHYVGFMIHSERKDLHDPDYHAVFDTICERRQAENAKLIYCSFGTIAIGHYETIISFLKKLINATHNQGSILIISLRSDPEILNQLTKSDRVYIFSSVPQLEVLRVADLFVTHGGLSSIKESIFAEVPMLMVPVHDDYDPKGNAARVFYHGLGLIANATNDVILDIEFKMQRLLTDPTFKKNVLAMKQKNSNYTANNFMSVFHSLTAVQ